MTKPDNQQRLQHILDAIGKIEKYLSDFDEEIFDMTKRPYRRLFGNLRLSVNRLRI